MTREDLEHKARMLAQNNWPDVASKLIIALVVEACCESLREGGVDIVHRAVLRSTFLPTEKPDGN